MLQLSTFAKFNKSTFRSIISSLPDYTYKFTTTTEYNTSCETCPYYQKIRGLENFILSKSPQNYRDEYEVEAAHTELDNIRNSCATYCKAKTKKMYNNDKKQYNLYHKKYAFKRLPKTATKLYLLLHFLPMIQIGLSDDPKMLITNVSRDKLAEYLKCNPKTIVNSLNILQSFYYINFGFSCDEKHYNIQIIDYEIKHLPAAKGGTGYITLSSTILCNILELSTINSVRSVLYKLLLSDNYTKDSETNQSVSMPTKDISKVLPSHVNYINKFKQLFCSDNLFETTVTHTKCMFKLKKAYNLQNDIKIFKEKNISLLKEYFNKNIERYRFITDGITEDIGNMSSQYSIHALIKSVDYIIDNYINENIIVNNIAGFVRTICQRSYTENLAM